ncbi:hypothetical protein [Rhodococcus opacus]|uniref:hypothetical protein n=1 Tax=Rhodococcus opacus TaxID=37919 RepID=UPI0029555E21|nr:hypothetical protein [Rhodococcus opacus]MDV7088661.1 hypothetical protein [Rhodococcus opacus]
MAYRLQTTPVPAGTPIDKLDWEHAFGHPVDADSTSFFDLAAPVNADNDDVTVWDAPAELPAERGTIRMRLG